jgi:phosphoserine phosphatase
MIRPAARSLVLAAALWLLLAAASAAQDLAAWRDGPSLRAIEGFVAAVERPGPDFVPPPQRIAVFDNDGTLWAEQPIYPEFAFALSRASAMARADPKLAREPAFQTALSGDAKAVAALDERQWLQLVVATHSGVTTEAFITAAHAWLATAKDPRFRRPHPANVYEPMCELMTYLRAHGFNVFIVTGGDADFVRAFAEGVYGVPSDHVIGSSSKTRFEQQDGRWVVVRAPEMVMDDEAAKPLNIALHIGVRPIFAAGNSDGDLQMLQYATSGPGRRLGLLVRHDDAEREYAYDRASKIGQLDKALDEAARDGWTVVSIRNDWRTVFPAQAAAPQAAP